MPGEIPDYPKIIADLQEQLRNADAANRDLEFQRHSLAEQVADLQEQLRRVTEERDDALDVVPLYTSALRDLQAARQENAALKKENDKLIEKVDYLNFQWEREIENRDRFSSALYEASIELNKGNNLVDSVDTEEDTGHKSRYHLWSLLEIMIEFEVPYLTSTFSNMSNLTARLISDEESDESVQAFAVKILTGIDNDMSWYRPYASFVIHNQLEELKEHVNQNFNRATAIVMLRVFKQSLTAELLGNRFLMIPSDKRELYVQTRWPFGDAVAGRFQPANKIRNQYEQSGKWAERAEQAEAQLVEAIGLLDRAFDCLKANTAAQIQVKHEVQWFLANHKAEAAAPDAP